MIEVKTVSDNGGAVYFNKEHGVWASYASATVGNKPPAEIYLAGIKLKDGRSVQFFVNRDNNLVCVDVIDADSKGGCEILRRTL